MKMVHFIPTTEKMLAEGLARLFRDNVWKLYGLPESIVSDRVSQMATYWFVIAWFNNQSVQKSEVRQAAKDVVKSEVYPQIYSF